MEIVKETLNEYDCILLAKMAIKSGPTQALRDFKLSRLIPGKDYVPLDERFKPVSRNRDNFYNLSELSTITCLRHSRFNFATYLVRPIL